MLSIICMKLTELEKLVIDVTFGRCHHIFPVGKTERKSVRYTFSQQSQYAVLKRKKLTPQLLSLTLFEDADGFLWLALSGTSRVARINPAKCSN